MESLGKVEYLEKKLEGLMVRPWVLCLCLLFSSGFLGADPLEHIKNRDFAQGIRELRQILAKDPFNQGALETLTLVRKEAQTRNPGGNLVWNYPIGLIPLVLAFLVGGVFSVLGAITLLKGRRLSLGRLAGALVLTSSLLALGVVLEVMRPEMAVVKTPIQGRKGDGEFYPVIPGQKWKSGQELWVHQRRLGWIKVQQGEGHGWIPAWSVFAGPGNDL